MARQPGLCCKFLRCLKCGNTQQIYRRTERNRKRGHIKHIWCWRCRKRTAHREMN